jgi:hypothetical protein
MAAACWLMPDKVGCQKLDNKTLLAPFADKINPRGNEAEL